MEMEAIALNDFHVLFIMIPRIIWRTILIYGLTVGGIWGTIEAFTYFSGDVLRVAVGPYWYLLYLAPLPVAILVSIVRERRSVQDVRPDSYEYQLFDSDNIYSPSHKDLSYSAAREVSNSLDQAKRSSIKEWLHHLPNHAEERRVRFIHDYVFKAAKAVWGFQQKWIDAKGRFFQGKATMPAPPVLERDGSVELGVGLSDQIDDWRDVGYREDWAPVQMKCDVYEGPGGHGFIFTARAREDETIWRIQFHFGPEDRPGAHHAQWVPE